MKLFPSFPPNPFWVDRFKKSSDEDLERDIKRFEMFDYELLSALDDDRWKSTVGAIEQVLEWMRDEQRKRRMQ